MEDFRETNTVNKRLLYLPPKDVNRKAEEANCKMLNS